MQTTKIYKSSQGEASIKEVYESALSKWPVPHDRLNISTRFGDTFVMAGKNPNAPALILLHGSGSNSAMWMGDVAVYSREFQIYCVDMPGEPGFSAPNRFSWKGAAFTQWLDDVLAGLKLDRAVFAGISLGGWAALKYALEQPGKVEKAVLICPGGLIQPRGSFGIRIVFYALTGGWGRKRMKKLIFRDLPITGEAEFFFDLTARFFNFRQGSPPIFSDEQLKKIKAPIFFLGGEADVIFDNQKAAHRLKNLVPHAIAKLYDHKGHALVNTAEIALSLLHNQP